MMRSGAIKKPLPRETVLSFESKVSIATAEGNRFTHYQPTFFLVRHVVFLLIGWSIVKSAWFEQSREVMGLGEAIMALSDNGPVYTLVAAGLILFGVFSLIVARYRIIPDVGHDLRRPRFRT